MTESEVWKPIEGYDYMISSLGRVKSLKFGREKIMKPRKDKDGYLIVNLHKDGKMETYRVHRLVVNAFIPNPKNLPEVNHINEIKSDNRVSNLEWITSQNNTRYSQAVAVNQFTLDGRFIRRWDCIMEVEYQLGFSNGNIVSCCKGRYKTAYGFIWRYA